MGTFIDKQTNMESDNKWNKLSMEQAQILSLLASNHDKSNKRSTSRNATNDDSGEQTKYQPRPWRTKAPKDGAPLEKVTKGGHTFKWDPVGNNGTGFWDFVKSGDNPEVPPTVSTSLKPASDDSQNVPAQKKAKKTVSFDENTPDATNVSVNKSRLLANLAHLDESQQSFIAQFVPKD